MKNVFTMALVCGLLFSLQVNLKAQKVEFPGMDKSPMDMAYFPKRAAFRAFEKTDEAKKANEPKIRVIYSRPQLNGRELFVNLEKYGQVWRVGANESTEIHFYDNVTIGGTKVKKGRYTIYVVPQEKEWEVHFSTDLDGWGHYAFKPEESTVAKITVPTEKTAETLEAFSVTFLDVEDGAHMAMGWGDVMVRVPIVF